MEESVATSLTIKLSPSLNESLFDFKVKLSSKNSDDIKSIFVEEVRSQEC